MSPSARPPARRYASVQTAAELLDVDPITVRRWISQGRITGYRVGARLIRVDLNEIEAELVQEIPAGPDERLAAYRRRHERRAR